MMSAALVTLVIAIPLADTLVFGLHEHVADGSRDVTALHTGHAHTMPHSTHHCDLGMNPAHFACDATVFPPRLVAPSMPSEDVSRPAFQPFLPFSPPRA